MATYAAGVGSTMIATLMGSNVVCVEVEAHFLEPMRASWEKMRQQPMLGCELGSVEICQWRCPGFVMARASGRYNHGDYPMTYCSKVVK